MHGPPSPLDPPLNYSLRQLHNNLTSVAERCGSGAGRKTSERERCARLSKKERSESAARSGRSVNGNGAMSGLSSVINFLEACARVCRLAEFFPVSTRLRYVGLFFFNWFLPSTLGSFSFNLERLTLIAVNHKNFGYSLNTDGINIQVEHVLGTLCAFTTTLHTVSYLGGGRWAVVRPRPIHTYTFIKSCSQKAGFEKKNIKKIDS
jgi:hypothetical protein